MVRAYIAGMGVVTPVGKGVYEVERAVRRGACGIKPLSLFKTPGALPSGEIPDLNDGGILPRIKILAGMAANEAMDGFKGSPDAVVMGVTTGGMLETEALLKSGVKDSGSFSNHSSASAAEYIADLFNCRGPAVTLSTACSSGACAIIMALDMIRRGAVSSVLAGGADSLCRLTYYGFNALQLIDPMGARPMDRRRNGMTVGEGAGMLLISSDRRFRGAPELLGGGLSCDAFHAATPHPSGRGALSAMESALEDAGILASDVDYINLHGTGTVENDRSEALAVNRLFGDEKPLLSSIKGAIGHSLAGAGAVEAVVSAIALSGGIIPANTGVSSVDPDLGLSPVASPLERGVHTVLSNSLGFGGNNASVIMGRPPGPGVERCLDGKRPLKILGSSVLTGAGSLDATMETLFRGGSTLGKAPVDVISDEMPPRLIRRLKRLPRMALYLAIKAREVSEPGTIPSSVFMGTGWGPLSETSDFLDALFETGEKFASPIDFVGSVHNSPAAQAAMLFDLRGPNITTTGGDYSFEQALMSAQLFEHRTGGALFLMGADESHPRLSELFDPSIDPQTPPSDGGGGFCLQNAQGGEGAFIDLRFYGRASETAETVSLLVEALGGVEGCCEYGAVFAGIPKSHRSNGLLQLEQFKREARLSCPVIDYRKITGEFASASAVASVMAHNCLERGSVPGRKSAAGFKKILVLGLGRSVTGVELAMA